MITVRVTTSTGETWTTGINATLDEARAYFMGHRFETLVPDRTSWAGVREKLMGPVTSVELIA
jgi:hypothetical protein